MVWCIAAFTAQAQNDHRLLLHSGTMQPIANVESFINESAITSGEIVNGYYYRLIQFNSIPTDIEKKRILQSGLLLMNYIPSNTFVTAIPQSFDKNLLKQLNVHAVIRQTDVQKVNTNLLSDAPAYAKTVNGFTDVVIQYYQNISPAFVASACQSYLKLSENNLNHTLSCRVPDAELMQLATQPWVYFITPAGVTSYPDDTKGRSLHRSNVINSDYATGRHFDGTGVAIGLGDDGDVGPHIDFTGRLTNYVGAPGLSHGDMTSGICVGAGNLDPSVRGMASGADLHVYDITNYTHIVNAQQNYDSLGIVITSTSFSQTACNQYTTETQLADQITHQNPFLNFVFSAGNAGNTDCGYGAGQGWGNITGGYKQGKNVITVGSVNSLDTIENLSSRGPASDGRIKPDITAYGLGQRSTDANNTYQTINVDGTSSACPGVAGVCAQLYQAYKASHGGTNPESPLIKACILNGAEDLGNAGPDYTYGWGRINAYRALKTLEDGRFIVDSISQGQSKTHPITVPSGVSEVRVMIYWLDPEGTPLASKELVNNINMRVSDPINFNWNPWVLNPAPFVNTLSAPAVRGIDSLNNVEQVTIAAGFQGTYNIHVDGFSIPFGPQKYYIVYEFRTAAITVTYPQGGEGFVAGEQEVIRWDAVKGLGVFTLDYSTNNGSSWTNISTTINQNLNEYTWTVPNSVTGSALIRVTRGSNIDVSDTVFAIIGVPQNVFVNYTCADKVNLKWDNVTGATSYTVYQLGNKFMDVIGTSATNSYVISGTDSTKEDWFSVAANTVGGNHGRRAIAIKKLPGTFNCPPDFDATIESASSPIAGSYTSCQGSSVTPVTVVIGNVGLLDINNFPVSYSLNNGTPVSETITDTIQAGQILVHTFAATLDYSVVGVNDLSIWTGLSTDQNTANDTLKILTTINASAIVTMPITDNFDSDVNCPTTTDCGATVCPLLGGWVNATNGADDNIDFRVNTGGTPTNNTGPDFDHTLGSALGKYIYLEASACFGQTAQLLSPCIDLTTASSPQFKFWYHMFGAAMGELHVDVLSGGNWINDVMPPISGDKGNFWFQSVIDLTAYNGQIITVRFRAFTGAASSSDLALDDINIVEGPVAIDASIASIGSPVGGVVADCQSSSTVPVTVTISNPGLTDIYNFPVSYSLNNATPVSEIITDTLIPGASMIHTFSGTLDYSAVNIYDLKAWTGLVGDLDNDNDTLNTITTVIAGTPVSIPVTDDFEADALCSTVTDCGVTQCPLLGGWINATNGVNDNIDFRVNVGGTPTNNTGPDFDHTLGTAAGKYIYLESSACFQQTALLLSPCIDLTTSSGPALQFWYHMFGAAMGQLHVDVFSGGNWINDVMNPIAGDKGNAWLQTTVDLTPYNGQVISIRFRAITGGGPQSDLALDDINILETHVAPDPSFTADFTSACVNTTITFTDKSTFIPNAWKWSFIPNTIVFVNGTSDTTQNPQVQFTATGAYDVKLVATNQYGVDSVTIAAYINILTPSSLTITEDFQGIAWPPFAWRVESAGNNNTWEQAINVIGMSGTSTNAAGMNNFTYAPPGGEDGLARQEISLVGTTHPIMTFEVAHRRRNNFTNDAMRIDVSTDCGNTYTPTPYFKQGAALATTPTPGGPPNAFFPNNANQWRKDTLDLTAWIGQVITLKFVNISAGGNNLYLDNINIGEFSSVSEQGGIMNVNIYPNPSINGYFNVTASANQNAKAVLTITDIDGKMIEQRNVESFNNNFNTTIDLHNQSKGLYFLEIKTGDHFSRYKLAIM